VLAAIEIHHEGRISYLTVCPFPASNWERGSGRELAAAIRGMASGPLDQSFIRLLAAHLEHAPVPAGEPDGRRLVRALRRYRDGPPPRELLDTVCRRLEASDTPRRGRRRRDLANAMQGATLWMNYKLNLALVRRERAARRARGLPWKWGAPHELAARLTADSILANHTPRHALNLISAFEGEFINPPARDRKAKRKNQVGHRKGGPRRRAADPSGR
jgi:hypothetical protein